MSTYQLFPSTGDQDFAKSYCKPSDIDDEWSRIQQVINSLPSPSEELLEGVQWGSYDVLYTPAFWKMQYHIANFSDGRTSHRLGNNIIEEVVACILGGFGLPAEMGLMAFTRLRERKLIKHDTDYQVIYEALREPFNVKSGKHATYRFYKQKSKYIWEFLKRGDLNAIPLEDDLQLRNWLLTIKGIGPKTASWITRNWLNSERVAILDIHLIRAGIIAGIFQKDSDVSKSYFELENKFLSFCQALDVKPSNMDALIWVQMKKSNRIALGCLTT